MKASYGSLCIEWDDKKDAMNIKKHGISFADASKIFLDNDRLEIYDTAHSEYEDRYITIGLVQKVLFVVYTERIQCLRMISARLATKEEEALYYGNCKDPTHGKR